jgi:hypothetical protein
MIVVKKIKLTHIFGYGIVLLQILSIGCRLEGCEEWLLSSPPTFNSLNHMKKTQNEYVVMTLSLYVLESCLWFKIE